MTHDKLVEKILHYFTNGSFADEVLSAKKDFFKWAGIFDEESPEFEMKMSQFIDFYVFSRPLSDKGKPPIEWCTEEKKILFGPEEKELLRLLRSSLHSLFEFSKMKGVDLHVKDLFSNYNYVIKNPQVTAGLEKGQIFEARLFASGDGFIFSGAFCWHPREANKFIKSEIKKIQKSSAAEKLVQKESLLLRLFKMRYKHEQYKHVQLLDIYSNDSKLRV